MFHFHPIIQAIYGEVHDWLSERPDLPKYRKKNAWNRLSNGHRLTKPDFESAALQYYVLFPAHAAKVGFTLETLIGEEKFATWLKHRNQITLIDVGCGAGAASVAFVNYLLMLQESGGLNQSLNIHFIGIDPNRYAIAIYNQQLMRLKTKVAGYDLLLSHKVIAESDLRAVNELRDELNSAKERWNIPYHPHTFLFQANVVSPFSTRFKGTSAARQELLDLGVDESTLSNSQASFGKEEATAFRQLLETASLDNLHIITVGTDGYEKRVGELALAIEDEFRGNNHVVQGPRGGEFSVKYEIPDSCFWNEQKNNSEWELKYCAEVRSISNASLSDYDWKEVNSLQNLRTAWARARRHLLGLTLVDEIEIRLFESNLDSNLSRLREQLTAYAEDIVHSDDRIHFKFPKSERQMRPVGLSRIEEEIISTALIQKLGQRLSGITSRSYAYRFARAYGEQNTEYLYENWFDAYGKYIQDARYAARRHDECVIVQTDIRSFYTRIIRDTLIQFSSEQLSRSARIEWLLRTLFSKEIDEHEAGKGIVQGNIASGFFANLYLLDLDARFGAGNEWGLEFFRYVDDMILIVPNAEDVDTVLTIMEAELKKVGLELNTAKTEKFDSVDEFIRATDSDKTLDKLQDDFTEVTNCLWILDSGHRQVFRNAYNESQAEWWYRVEVYQRCLHHIGIYIEIGLLSRRLYKYLFNEGLCKRENTWDGNFSAPMLPNSNESAQISAWRNEFEAQNGGWVLRMRTIANTLEKTLIESKELLLSSQQSTDARDVKLQTRNLRFCLNKLIQIDFPSEKTSNAIVEVLSEAPWMVRNPHKLVEQLAIRQNMELLEKLLATYDNESDVTNEYMKSITLRALRFLHSITEDLWEKIVASSIGPSDVVRLMATETWLYIMRNQPDLVQVENIEAVGQAIRRYSKPILRIWKNYMLILGEYGLAIDLYKVDELSSSIYDVAEVIQSGEVDSLFDYCEPEILTREFYSGYRSDDGFDQPSRP